MAGRKPKPTALKKLEGNPGKRKLNMKEPVLEKKNKKFEPFLILWKYLGEEKNSFSKNRLEGKKNFMNSFIKVVVVILCVVSIGLVGYLACLKSGGPFAEEKEAKEKTTVIS